MSMLLDHAFILTEPNASSAERLTALGLREGSSNTHSGQGTSNRRFFLDNFTIELLFVSDPVEAANGAGKRLNILARTRDKNASPFGIVTRVSDVKVNPDFPSWQYFPDYFPDDLSFYVGRNSDQLIEPLCICMPPSLPKPQGVPSHYANPDWRLTKLSIQVPETDFSATLGEFASISNVKIESGSYHRMTMEFNHGVTGRSENLMPVLPLILDW